MDETIATAVAALNRNWFDAHVAETREEARRWLLDRIPPPAIVGAGDSGTVRQIGLWEVLAQRGNTVLNAFTQELTMDPAHREDMVRTMRQALNSDVFITGVNAVTSDGKLVATDRVGNRLAGMLFGAPRVLVVAGRNKIVPNVEDALARIKEVVAPAHAGWKGRKTPCAATGQCNDCSSRDRICGATLIIEKRPHLTSMSVLLVAEDLGLGWDPAWPAERIESIRRAYQQVTWSFPSHQSAPR
ncbi:MAG: lactate utilization protein [Chloroflexi bacterium]|nr:lactate utilization protein [Chloroflexota bacterium]